MEILSDRYFIMNEDATSEGRMWYAEKPYLAQSYLAEGKTFVDFYAENGLFTMEYDLFDEFIYEWDLTEVDAYKCPCCERMSLNKVATDYKRGGLHAYYVKDEVQNIKTFVNDEYHYFGLRIYYCPVCGGKV